MLVNLATIEDLDISPLERAATNYKMSIERGKQCRAQAESDGWNMDEWSRSPEADDLVSATKDCEAVLMAEMIMVPTYLWNQPRTKAYLAEHLGLDVIEFRMF